ncbi:MAG: dephospho-CoA kinase [Chloroflexi bacterium]|nr:dephospho-CoA kinase [Chloroflexota bacterium]MDA1241166.1 dephospho-CoA kinase [Chloroflexota bacterium]MQC25767.1 dephospho-CoA kinase [Chloroflexota bacterium]MQC47896.1 dephospho-CoA kinase [Chloroflexota bacterium]
MSVIGLTGGIAAGKSTASEILREFGAVIIDADRLGHRSYEPGTSGFEKVVNHFGHDVVGKDGTIDRRILGGKVFGAPGELQRLNELIWPEIRTLIREEIAQIRTADKRTHIVLEAAVLIEAGWQDLCDEIWVVYTTTKTAVDRLRSRNGLTEDAALQRINSQMSTRDRLSHAQVKIDNSETEAQLRLRMEKAWKSFLGRQPKVAGAKAAPKAAAKAAAKPAAQAVATKTPAKAAARPAAKPAAKKAVIAKAAAKPAAKKPVVAKAAAKPAAKKAVTAKAAAKPAARPAAKKAVAAKVVAKPAAKKALASKAPAKAAAKPAAKKVAAKPVARAAAKAAARPAPKKAAVKPAARTAARPAATRAAAKPAARTATRATNARTAPAAKKPAARPAARAGAARK